MSLRAGSIFKVISKKFIATPQIIVFTSKSVRPVVHMEIG